MSIEILGFVLTYKCNANCVICCIDANYSRNEKMSYRDAKNYIEQAKDITTIKEISLTGGEPFIFFETLKNIISYATNQGFKTNCVTNGYWAKNSEIAYKKLKSLVDSGLYKICISIDEFHQEFVPLQYITNCLNAAKELDLQVGLYRTFTINSKPLKYFLVDYGIREGDYITREELYYEPRKLISKEVYDRNKIIVSEGSVTPAGRALNIPESDLHLIYYEDLLGYCMFLHKMPAIHPNGDVYACCTTAGLIDALYIGNAKQENLSELFKKSENDSLINYLRVHGPVELVKKIKEQNVFIHDKYTNICHICKELFDNKKYRELIQQIIKKNYFETLLSKATLISKGKL